MTIAELSAIAGVDPHSQRLSLRELTAAAEAKRIEDWDHTATVMSLLANLHRDPKSQPALMPVDFHPYRSAKRRKRRKSRFTTDYVARQFDELSKDRPAKLLKPGKVIE